MSVSLNCPNCGAAVGETSSEDNYKEKYYYEGEDGQPICETCGAGTFGNLERNIIIIIFVITYFISIPILIYFLS